MRRRKKGKKEKECKIREKQQLDNRGNERMQC